MKDVEINVLPSHFEEDQSEKEFFIELGRATGGAKTGTRRAAVKIIGGEGKITYRIYVDKMAVYLCLSA